MVVPSGNDKSYAPGRKKCWRPDMDELHGPGVFPHLRAGAARRPLSSKTKPGKSEKVPDHPENFRHLPDDLECRWTCSGFAGLNSRASVENGTDATNVKAQSENIEVVGRSPARNALQHASSSLFRREFLGSSKDETPSRLGMGSVFVYLDTSGSRIGRIGPMAHDADCA
jgi:hypothetical protein